MPDTSLSRFISNVFSTSLGRVSIVVFGVICTIIYARWMPPDEYGGFVLLQILVNLGLTFGNFGMESVITRFIAATEGEDERQKIVNTGLLFIFSCLILTCLLIFIFQDLLSQLLSGYIPKNLLVYVPILLLTEGMRNFFSFVLKGEQKFSILAGMNFIYGLFSLILTILFVIYLKLGALGLVWASLIPQIITCTISILSVKVKINFRFDTGIFKKMFKFSIPLYGNNLLAFAYSRVDTLIIGIFFGPAEIAIFEFARRIPDTLQMFYDSFIDVYFSFIAILSAGDNREDIGNMVNHANRLTGLLGGIAVIFSFGFGEQFFLLVFSERYLASIPVFIILMVVLIVLSLNSNLGYSLIAIGEPAKPLYTNIIRFCFVLASYFVFIPYFKIIGVALSALFGLVCALPLNTILLKHRFSDVKWGPILKPLFLLALAFIPIYFISHKVILMFIIIVFYIAGAFSLGIISTYDIKRISLEIQKLASRSEIKRIL